ncbi:MAG: TRAP transporter substrate-binding protein DctP [Deltaproteobacteria bacterium]|nr:TRAP transporter substrate-binding protein DctP [Deltaproteobacteria bacterium]
MGKRIILSFSIVLLLFVGSTALSAPLVFKFSTLAPEGTSWINLWREMASAIETESNDRIKMVTFAGGVVGDEPDMVRKMRLGQIHMIGVTVNGIRNMVPEMDAFQLPFLFEDENQVDFVRQKMRPTIDKLFIKHNYKLLIWVDNGFMNFYSKNPFRTPEELAQQKVWVWSGDPIPTEIFKSLGVSPIPTDVPSVLSSLQTGLLNAVYTSPLACVALQWCSEAKYATLIKMRYETAVIAMPLPLWQAIPKNLQQILQRNFNQYSPRFFETVWKDHHASIEVMKENGIAVVDLSPRERELFIQKTRPLWDQLADRFYPRWLLNEIQKTLQGYSH